MSNFSNYKKFENVGIRSSNDTLIVMDSSNNNISLHSSDGGDDNVDTLSIKNIINKTPNMDLNLSSLNGTTINPVITINNNHGDCRITTNLNVNGNLNITKNLIIPTHNNSNLLSNVKGSIYFNTTENMYEGYVGADPGQGWQPLGGFSKTKDAVIHKNLNVIGNINLTNEGMIKTTGQGSFGSINCGVGTFTTADINNGTIDNVTIANSTWNGNAIADGYIASSGTWNGKQNSHALLTSLSNAGNGTNGYALITNGSGSLSWTEEVTTATYARKTPSLGKDIIDTDASQTMSNKKFSDSVSIGHTGTPVQTLHVSGTACFTSWVVIGTTSWSTNNGGYEFAVLGESYLRDSYASSDDRLKKDEELIENATATLLKLRPQKYKKYNDLNEQTEFKIESGLIAQEIYYEVPELRHIVRPPSDATLTNNYSNVNFSDIKNDPNYDDWGTTPAAVSYNGLISYLIKGFQEQNTIINTQQTKIDTLETENAELKSIIDKLKTANSFEEFKNSL